MVKAILSFVKIQCDNIEKMLTATNRLNLSLKGTIGDFETESYTCEKIKETIFLKINCFEN